MRQLIHALKPVLVERVLPAIEYGVRALQVGVWIQPDADIPD